MEYVRAHSGAQHPSELLNMHNWYVLIAVVFFINSVLKLSSFCFHYFIDVSLNMETRELSMLHSL